MSAKELRGVIPALISPMRDGGELDLESLEKHVGYLSEAGVHGFFVAGTTAEGAYLTTAEKRAAFQVVRQVTAGRQFLCLACICPSTPLVLEEMRALSDLKPDYWVAVTPYYMKVSQADILAHYREVGKAANAPVIVYNIPGNTHNPIALETVVELAAGKPFAGTKDSSGDFISFSRGVLSGGTRGFVWIQGEDYLHGPSMLIGAGGMVSGLGNVDIRPYVQMYAAAQKQDWETVRECQRRINRLYAVIRVAGGRVGAAIKAGVEHYGRCRRRMRIRSMTLAHEEAAGVVEALREFERAEGG